MILPNKNTGSRPISALTRPDRIAFRFPYLSRSFSLPIYPVFVFVPQVKYENENGRGIFPTVPDRFHPYVHGRLTCPYCAKDIDCFRLSAGGKICYFDCNRCFLPFNHPFRRQRKEFRKGTIVTKGSPKRHSGIEIIEEHRKLVLDESGKRYQGFGEEHNWTHICGLWELPYAKSLILMHNIDVMHQESNFCQALINTCMDFPDKTKDNDKARMDLAMICDRPTQVLREN
jgi:hypothetical protein